jgi:hypothetical protein
VDKPDNSQIPKGDGVDSPLEIEAPDDTGSDVYARFRYQARVAFPYCLACAVGDSIRSVTLEHIEDILVEGDDGIWRFIQVKTRDAVYGHWRLTHLLSSGGALHSLFRAHQVLNASVNARLEAHLEGTCAPGDSLLQELVQVGGRPSDGLCDTVRRALHIDRETARTFLERVSVYEKPRRDAIERLNLSLIVARRGGLTDTTIMTLHERLTDDICRAMEAAPLGENWIQIAIGQDAAEDHRRRRFEAKRLTAERLDFYRSILEHQPLALLTALDDDSDSEPVSDLERKLRAAGASDALVTRAKVLRSSASRHELGLLSKMLNPSDQRLEDLQERLLTVAVPVADMYRGQRRAAHVFNAVLSELRRDPASVDPHKLFNRDGMLLMGALCQLSAECRADWG